MILDILNLLTIFEKTKYNHKFSDRYYVNSWSKQVNYLAQEKLKFIINLPGIKY